MEDELPDWESCAPPDLGEDKRSALQKFVYDNEPAGPGDRQFRVGLLAVIKEVRIETASTVRRVTRSQPVIGD